jgi:hypothetical protein
MTLQNCKTISKPSQHAESRGLTDESLTLPQRKGVRQRKQEERKQSKHAQQKPNSKAGQLVDYRSDSGTLKLKLPHLTEGGADQAAVTERQKIKKKKTLPNYLARLQQSFSLNTNTRTGCWRSNTRT